MLCILLLNRHGHRNATIKGDTLDTVAKRWDSWTQWEYGTWFLRGWCCEGRSLWAWLSLVMADAPESMCTEPTGVGFTADKHTDQSLLEDGNETRHLSPLRRGTYYLPANPVIGVIKGVSFPLKQLSKKCPQVFVVWLLKEVQPPHITQVGGHLLWNPRRFKFEKSFHWFINKKAHTGEYVASFSETFEKKQHWSCDVAATASNWLTWEVLTQDLDRSIPLSVSDLLVSFFQSVRLNEKRKIPLSPETHDCDYVM